jgi:hypothetical protein
MFAEIVVKVFSEKSYLIEKGDLEMNSTKVGTQ